MHLINYQLPEVGKVILFPSYLPHETVDFSSEEKFIFNFVIEEIIGETISILNFI